MIHAYLTHILIMISIYAILAVSLNLTLGYTGLLNLGHVAFFGIGAYASALLTQTGVPFLLAFILAGLLSSVFGFILMYATQRLRGDYLALSTLGFNFVIYSLMLNLVWLTRGPLGIPGIQKPSLLGITLISSFSYLAFSLLIAAITILFIHKVVSSPFGRLLQATRDDELGLRVLGKDTFRLKAKAMMLSAFFAGIAGSLYSHYITFIDPSPFTLTELILVLTIVIAGGIASIKGSVIMTAVILLIPEALRFLALPSTIIGPARQAAFALILLAILLYKPKGLFGKVDLA